jgi:hypothetical protein
MKHVRFSFLFFASVFLLLGLAGAARADNRTWVGGESNKLVSDSRNWDGHLLPVSGDALVFPPGNIAIWDISGLVPVSVTSGADMTLQQSLTVSGDLTLTSDQLHINGQSLNAGSLTINGGELDQGASPVAVSGNWTFNSGSVSLAAGTVSFIGSGNKTVHSGGQHFGNLLVNAIGATVSLSDDLAVDGALSISNGILSIGNKTLTVQGGINQTGGTLSLGSGGNLVLAGTTGRPLASAGGIFSAGTGSTVSYNSITGSIVVEPLTYYGLVLNGNTLYSLSADTTALGTADIRANASLSLAGHVLSVPSGQLTNAGIILDGVIRAPALSLAAFSAAGSPITAINSSSDSITLRVEDRDLNRRGMVAETVSGAITVKTLNGDSETLVLNETGPMSGVFTTGNLVVHQGAAIAMNGQIEVGQNDVILVSYADPYDSSDVKTAQITVSLSGNVSSGTPQIISGPQVGQFSAQNSGSGTTYTVHVGWVTDITTTSAVSISSPALTAPLTAGSLTGVTSHDVAASGLLRGVAYAVTVSSVSANGKTVTSKPLNFTVILPGDRIKTSSSPAVYWYLNGKRNVFSDFTAYDSWFSDFKGVVVIPADQMGSISLGKNVPIRAGTYLVKIQSDPKVYLVEPMGLLRWVPTEAQALALYGGAWSKRVRDVDVSQFVNYTVGSALAAGAVPDNFVYQTGGEWNVVIGGVTHVLPDAGKKTNGIASRFVSSIAPSVVASLASGGSVLGYASDLNGVFQDGQTAVNAPAFGI